MKHKSWLVLIGFGLLLVLLMVLFSNPVSAAVTLETGFESRGMCDDLRWAMYDTGGTNRAYYNKYTNYDLFSDTAVVDDFVFICMSAPFSGFYAVGLTTPIASVSHTFYFEYYNGTCWTNFTDLTDSTNNFTQAGYINWTQPTDWETWGITSNVASKSGGYAQYLLKIKIATLDTWTEGGHLTGYQYARQKYIYLNDGGSHTPASLYADDVAGGWGVITKKGDYAYDISCGFYFRSGTFTFNAVKIQIGDAGSPNYVPFRVYGTILLCNDGGIYMSDDLASSFIVYSKGALGTMSFYPNKASALYNLYIAQPWDTHYSRFATGSYGGTGQMQWYNVLIGSMMYPTGSFNFNRINFQNIQYLLSAGDTIYNSCIFGKTFSKDPSYAPVITRPLFDGGSTANHDWMSQYNPASITRQHHMDVISGSWTKGNKWKCVVDDYNPTSTVHSHIMIYSQYLNVDVFDVNGTALSNATLSLKNATGFSVLWEDLPVVLTSTPSDATDTSWVVNDSSLLSLGDKILFWGEIINITNIAGNTLTVERGLYNSSRVYGLRDYFVPLRRQVVSMNINETQDEIYVLERVYYKYSLDGGVTSTGNLYKDYGATTITVSKTNYTTYNATLEIRDELDLTVSLKSHVWNYSPPYAWHILNLTDTMILKLTRDGDLAIAGELYELTNTPPPGDTVAFQINDTLWLTKSGDLYIEGELVEETNFYNIFASVGAVLCLIYFYYNRRRRKKDS